MKLRLVALVAVLLALLGVGAALAVVTTGEVTACATADVAAHTIDLDGAPIATVPGASSTKCVTSTYTVSTETVTVPGPTTTVTTTVTSAAAPGHTFGFATGSPQFIVSYGGSDFAGTAQHAADLGAKVLRSDYQAFVGSAYDRLSTEATARGLEMVPVLTDKIKAGKTVADAQAYAHDLATRHPETRKVELGNEPNGPQFGGAPNPELYTQLACAASQTLRAELPGVTLIAGGLAQYGANTSAEMKPIDFLTRALAAGLGSCVDHFALHTEDDWGWGTLRPQVHDFLVSKGLGDRPLDITENDECSAPGPQPPCRTEQAQADTLTARFTEAKTTPWLGDVYEYSLRNLHSTSSQQDNYGVLRLDWTAKPAAAAFQAVVSP